MVPKINNVYAERWNNVAMNIHNIAHLIFFSLSNKVAKTKIEHATDCLTPFIYDQKVPYNINIKGKNHNILGFFLKP